MEATTDAPGQLDGLLARLNNYHLKTYHLEQEHRVLLTPEYKDLLREAGYKSMNPLQITAVSF